MDADNLRGIAAGCTVIGSLLLAWRVTGILKALGEVAKVHENNIRNLSQQTGDIFLAINSINWIEKAQKLSLLIAGFGLSIFGGLLQLIASFWGI